MEGDSYFLDESYLSIFYIFYYMSHLERIKSGILLHCQQAGPPQNDLL